MEKTYNKLAAIGILIFGFYIAWLLVVIPYMDTWQDRIRGVEILQAKHIRLSQMINNKDEIDHQYHVISNSQGLSEVFLNNRTGALADVKLQRIIKQVVGKSGGKLIQSVITTGKKRSKDNRPLELEGDKSVTVNVLMQGSINSIYKALHQLENSRPLILISNFQILHNRSRYQVTRATDNTFYRARYDATAFIL